MASTDSPPQAAADSPAIDVVCRHEHHNVFVPPTTDEATIWRYLDFTKLVSLIDSQRLFFPRVDTFDDAFEGSISAATRAAREKFWSGLEQEQRDARLRDMQRMTESSPSWMYASCWNLSEVESAALWGLYVQPASGVAIRSTYRRLIQSITSPGPDRTGAPCPLWVGKVSYIDYDSDPIPGGNTLYPFVHKRRSFEFESELRAMTWSRSPEAKIESSPLGLRVAVDLNELISAIHVSPTAPEWFASLVRSVVDQYGCVAPVHQSALSGQPIY